MGKTVALFVTCLADLLFPEVGEATVKVLRKAGCRVTFPAGQTCCGQPAFNSGYRREATRLARRFVELFESADAVVAPSGSCTLMVRREYPHLFAHDPALRARAEALAARTFDLATFLVDVLRVTELGARLDGKVTYHDSCHLNRGLGVYAAPRRLLHSVEGLELVEMANSDRCCGFGGTFAVKMPDISAAMLGDKLDRILETGAQAVVVSDASCGMQIAGGLSRRGSPIKVIHLAQVLSSVDFGSLQDFRSLASKLP
jgi:L-lactate dehydrogenase complex protein LldE